MTILVSLKLKGSESGVLPSKVKDGFLPCKVTIQISDFLTRKYLGVHCKDRHNDLGYHKLNVGETYSFSIWTSFLQNTTLYFCRFAWDGAVHYFDIYVQDRDLCCVGDNQCSWKIYETQPCEIKLRSRECFQWNTIPKITLKSFQIVPNIYIYISHLRNKMYNVIVIKYKVR